MKEEKTFLLVILDYKLYSKAWHKWLKTEGQRANKNKDTLNDTIVTALLKRQNRL